MEQQQSIIFKPQPSYLTCSHCSTPFHRPVTLNCGHTFCHSCLIQLTQQTQKSPKSLVPLCPTCHLIIWKPINSLKENVVISNLVRRYHTVINQTPIIAQPSQNQKQYHILLDCAESNYLPLPHCFCQIVFATAFIDQIIQQQSQTNHIILRWPGAPESVGLAGRLLRPEIYHYSIKTEQYETVFRAQFQGKQFVKLIQWQQIDLKLMSASDSNQGQMPTSSLILCLTQDLKAINPVSIQTFQPFFEVYDKLNNPIYLRQISQIADERIFQQRNDPQKLIYCVMRILRLQQKQMRRLAESMDDQIRWNGVLQYLHKNELKQPVEIVRVDIPGNYPHALVFAILLLLIVFHYLAR